MKQSKRNKVKYLLWSGDCRLTTVHRRQTTDFRFSHLIFLLLVTCLLCANTCNQKQSIDSIQQYLKWINNPENGLVKERVVNGIRIKAKFMPPEYLAYNELKNDHFTQEKFQQLVLEYGRSRTFLLSIFPDNSESTDKDLMFQGVLNKEQYKERMLKMNFTISENISLKLEESFLKPVLVNLENTYGLEKGRKLNIVFAPEEENNKDWNSSDQLDLIYDDEIFDMGRNHFLFSRQDFENIPNLKWNHIDT